MGQCRVKICKCQPNVCQIRLDFNTFVIAGPSTSVSTIGLATFGVLEVGGAKGVSTATQCLTDMFSVTNPNGAAPPVICGTNTGEHMVKLTKRATAGALVGSALLKLILSATGATHRIFPERNCTLNV